MDEERDDGPSDWQHLDWVYAMDPAWSRGDLRALIRMLRSDRPMPPRAREALADLLEGQRLPARPKWSSRIPVDDDGEPVLITSFENLPPPRDESDEAELNADAALLAAWEHYRETRRRRATPRLAAESSADAIARCAAEFEVDPEALRRLIENRGRQAIRLRAMVTRRLRS